MIPPTSSLVKYNSPILVSTTKTKSVRSGRKSPVKLNPSNTSNQPQDSEKSPSKTDSNTTVTEDILNSILPPKEWTEDSQLWVQYVSSTPATRLDVVNLQDQLDLRLQQRQARETGICPIREELYGQCFDELIRQVTLNCAERGLLLLRVRDEARMTIAAYQTLYESSIAFGMRKALIAEHKKLQAHQYIKQLQTEQHELRIQIDELTTRCEAIKAREEERKVLDEKKHAEEMEELKKVNDTLKNTLDTLLSTPT